VVGYGDTQEEADANHDENLRKLLDRAREVKLKLNSKKMNLKKPQVKFMGHVISKEVSSQIQTKSKQWKTCPSQHVRKRLLVYWVSSSIWPNSYQDYLK